MGLQLFFSCICLAHRINFQVNVSELGLVTPAGKVVWGEISFDVICLFCITLSASIITVCHGAGKYAQVTNNPENDGCINAVLLV
jgi:ribosome biogenesis protein NSA2